MRSQHVTSPSVGRSGASPAAHYWVIALMAFLTVVDLFAAQALLPVLAEVYGASAAAMGTAVSACTLGMAISGLAVARLGTAIDRRTGVTVALALLAVPTALLATAPSLAAFAALRVAQGLCMAAAFAWTLAHLAEEKEAAAMAVSAYITGNVASNLFGRLIAAYAADTLGAGPSFNIFAALNVLGAALAWVTLGRMKDEATHRPATDAGMSANALSASALSTKAVSASDMSTNGMAAIGHHLRDARLRASFAIGFCILFVFIGTFSYVNFVLVRPPLSLAMTSLGLVYLVFLPSLLTTPSAGRLAARFGTPVALRLGLAIAAAGLPLLLAPTLAPLLAGLALVAVGTFLAQAVTTAYVGSAAPGSAGTASGIYLASYFLGGMAGSACLGQLFVHFGWPATVAGIAAVLLAAMLLAGRLVPGVR